MLKAAVDCGLPGAVFLAVNISGICMLDNNIMGVWCIVYKILYNIYIYIVTFYLAILLVIYIVGIFFLVYNT